MYLQKLGLLALLKYANTNSSSHKSALIDADFSTLEIVFAIKVPRPRYMQQVNLDYDIPQKKLLRLREIVELLSH